MILYKIGVCGHFAEENNYTDGQSIKTRIFSDELARIIGKNNIEILNTRGWKINPLKLFLKSILLIKKCDHIVILPGKNGIKVFIPLFTSLKKFFKTKVHYVVIGGWLPDFLEKNKQLLKYIKQLDSIHVETGSMISRMNDLGVRNIFLMPNFKRLNSLTKSELLYQIKEPFKLCTFSRVLKEKGIEEAINAVTKINQKYKKVIFTLDIFGKIDENYKDDFLKIIEQSEEYIKYQGVVSYEKSVETLKEYYLLLFPTYYSGEGFAGTLIDALAAGVPVIASDWKYNSEIIKNGYVGYLFDVGNTEMLSQLLEMSYKNPQKINNMKINCINEYKNYSPENILTTFLENIKYY